MTMRWLILAAVAACACPAKPATTTSGSGSGSNVAAPSGCDALRPKLEQLYRAEAQAKEPKRVDEAVADNTTMVMNDCARDPAKVSACVGKAQTVPEVEKCLRPIDEEGTEGEELRK